MPHTNLLQVQVEFFVDRYVVGVVAHKSRDAGVEPASPEGLPFRALVGLVPG
jgi:hypothetical protein